MTASSAAVDFDAFEAFYEEARVVINDHISSMLDEEEEFAELRKLLELATAGGKRVRPTLTLLMADVVHCPTDRALDHAAIVELLHNATLVSDDWVDRDNFRRELPAVWRVLYDVASHAPSWVKGLTNALPEEVDPRTLTVLAAHDLQAIAIQLVKDPGVQQAMAEGVRHVFKGFFLEGKNMAGGVWKGGRREYIETVRFKTGGFFGMATWLPSVIAPVNSDVEEAARKYGEFTGILFQICDDFVDGDLPAVVGDPEAELETWYENAVEQLSALPVQDERQETLLRTAPAWAVYRMLDQEDMVGVLDLSFLPGELGP